MQKAKSRELLMTELHINENDIAWASGIIEGEGSIQATNRTTNSSFDGRKFCYYTLRVVMTDLDIIERLKLVFGFGIVGNYSNLSRLGKKPIYRWDVRRRFQAETVCILIYPYMGTRRKSQIDLLFQMMDSNPFIDNAEKVRRMWITRRKNLENIQSG